jgi:predicted nucleic acid-binding protein
VSRQMRSVLVSAHPARLRDNLTLYDASYVALAEALDVTLITADSRIGRTPGLTCPTDVLRSM